MSAHTVLTCDIITGRGRCRRSTDIYHTCIVSFARELAAGEGWTTATTSHTGEIRDLCPDCAPRRPIRGRSVPGPSCPAAAACHLLGHGATGHRITNLLAQAGLTLEQACALTDRELCAFDGIGAGIVSRIRRATEPRLPRPRP